MKPTSPNRQPVYVAASLFTAFFLFIATVLWTAGVLADDAFLLSAILILSGAVVGVVAVSQLNFVKTLEQRSRRGRGLCVACGHPLGNGLKTCSGCGTPAAQVAESTEPIHPMRATGPTLILTIALSVIVIITSVSRLRGEWNWIDLVGAFVVIGTGINFTLSKYKSAVVKEARCRRKLGLCVDCGYDLRGSPERWPECGKARRRRRTKARG